MNVYLVETRQDRNGYSYRYVVHADTPLAAVTLAAQEGQERPAYVWQMPEANGLAKVVDLFNAPQWRETGHGNTYAVE